MSDINSVFLSGTIVKLEVREGERGPRASLNIVNHQQYKGKEYKTYIRAIAWGETASQLRSLSDGDRILVSGRWSKSSWEDKETGDRKYRDELVVNTIELLGAEPTDIVKQDSLDDIGF